MRPSSIIAFERVALLAIAVGLLGVALSWNAVVAAVAGHGYGPGFVAASNALIFGLILVLLFLVSRRRSNVARWIWIVLFAFGVAHALATGTVLASGSTLGKIMDGAGWLLGAIGVWLLLRRDSAEWFARRGSVAA